jgi:hypothetical protein
MYLPCCNKSLLIDGSFLSDVQLERVTAWEHEMKYLVQNLSANAQADCLHNHNHATRLPGHRIKWIQ